MPAFDVGAVRPRRAIGYPQATRIPGMMRDPAPLLPTESVLEFCSAFFFVLPLLLQAYLLQYKNTALARQALCPIAILSAARSSLRYSLGSPLLDFIFFGMSGAYAIMKGVEWACRPSEEYQWLPEGQKKQTLSRFQFPWELATTLRGIDWSFGVPRDRLPPCLPSDTKSFVLASMHSMLFWHITTILCLAPLLNMQNYGSGTIQDYLRSWGLPNFPGFDAFGQLFQACCLGQATFSGMEYGNVSLTFAAFLLQSLGHQLGLTAPFDPSRWPVLFNRPYSLTSLNDLWSRRWHALFFRQFIALGLKPGRALFRWTGRKPSLACGLLCAFLVSGLMHEWGFYAAQRHLNVEFDASFTTTRFFVLQAFGILAEQLYTGVTGYRVDGWLGRIWALTFLFSTATSQVTFWVDRGLVNSLPPMSNWQLVRFFVPFAPMLPRWFLAQS